MNERPVEVQNWGKDHWSTFAYAEHLAVEHKGIIAPDMLRMRCKNSRQVRIGKDNGIRSPITFNQDYPTRLKDGEVSNHDDWDCLYDAVSAGLLEEPSHIGTGLIPVFKLTEQGKRIAAQLRQHKVNGGRFADFQPIMEIQS